MRFQTASSIATATTAWLLMSGIALAQAPSKVFTVANYPVEAVAKDAVAAKAQAIADGQRAAFKSLLKRLLPVTSYARLQKLAASTDASRLVDSIAVRRERNSTTEYIASLDFNFQPQAVKALLDREGLAFSDQQAPEVTIVPIWRAPADTPGMPADFGPTQGPKSWSDAWAGLDLKHAMTPAKLETLKPNVHADTVKAIAAGNTAMWRTFAGSYGGNERLIAALAEPDMSTAKLTVTLMGYDAAGALAWAKGYRVDMTEPGYAIELAAIVSLGVLEGRWKATSVRGGGAVAATRPAAGGGWATTATVGQGEDRDLVLNVRFRGMGEWQDISRRLSATPGVENIDVVGMSDRGARVSLRYAGGAAALADAVGTQGLSMRETGSGWTLSGQ